MSYIATLALLCHMCAEQLFNTVCMHERKWAGLFSPSKRFFSSDSRQSAQFLCDIMIHVEYLWYVCCCTTSHYACFPQLPELHQSLINLSLASWTILRRSIWLSWMLAIFNSSPSLCLSESNPKSLACNIEFCIITQSCCARLLLISLCAGIAHALWLVLIAFLQV